MCDDAHEKLFEKALGKKVETLALENQKELQSRRFRV